jgi:hypothetical protein
MGAKATPHIEREIYLMDEAIRRCLAMPQELLADLDNAAKTGRAVKAARLAMPADGWTTEWDGTVDGEHVGFASEVLWCTLRDRYGWGIPTAEAVELVRRTCGSKAELIEFGAGSGYTAAVLTAAGLKVQAIDHYPDGFGTKWSKQWFDVTEANAIDVIRANPSIPVLISWADPTGIGRQLANAMEPGRTLLICGPREVTGDDAFNSCLEGCFRPIDSAAMGSASGRPDTLRSVARNHIDVLKIKVRRRKGPWERIAERMEQAHAKATAAA